MSRSCFVFKIEFDSVQPSLFNSHCVPSINEVTHHACPTPLGQPVHDKACLGRFQKEINLI